MAVRKKVSESESIPSVSTSQQNNNFTTALLLIAVVLLVVIAFMMGALWQKVGILEKSKTTTGTAAQAGVQVPTGGNAPTPANPMVSVKADTLNLEPVGDKDHVRGVSNAQITFVEYSDLECPFCKKIHPDVQKLMTEYQGKIRWVYRHFPLTQLHPKAYKEAEATECVAELAGEEAFWKYTDKIYEVTPANNGLDEAQLPKLAVEVGVNKSAFDTCLASGRLSARVQKDLDSGTKAGVTGTPGSFILDNKGNAWVIPGALPYASLKQIVDQALAQ